MQERQFSYDYSLSWAHWLCFRILGPIPAQQHSSSDFVKLFNILLNNNIWWRNSKNLRSAFIKIFVELFGGGNELGNCHFVSFCGTKVCTMYSSACDRFEANLELLRVYVINNQVILLLNIAKNAESIVPSEGKANNWTCGVNKNIEVLNLQNDIHFAGEMKHDRR